MRIHLPILLDMLSYARPADSSSEAVFIARYLTSLPDASQDHAGNTHVIVGKSPILWSCHTDTVHRMGGRQTIHYDSKTGIVTLSKRSHQSSACLGADDTAGVFLCREMILAGIPGHYIFHRSEECGGIGSSDLAAHDPALIQDSRFAIALDRRGYGDVITSQCGRCASDVFAQSLADQLNQHGLAYKPSDRGLFTDTANYTDLIGECTNLSIGYEHAHSRDECLDVRFLDRLFIALCVVDPSALVESRKPADPDDTWTNDWTYFPMRQSWKDGEVLQSFSRDYRSGKPASQIVWSGECEYCGILFERNASDAVCDEVYCSKYCEERDWEISILRAQNESRHRESIYLDPAYEEVQSALRRVK